MRIRILRTPHITELDGIDLRRFAVGQDYEVGNRLGAVMLAEGWAEPLADDGPALLIPFSDDDPFMTRTLVRQDGPSNLRREAYPPYGNEIALASDLDRRKRRRSTTR
jgi:hypothetical protein